MPYRSSHRFARCSAQKARLVVDLVRGRDYDEAIGMLELSKKRAAVYVRKTLEAAAANADQAEADVRNLVVTEAFVDEGPTMKRFQPKDRGRAHPILKRTCHINVAVDEKQAASEPATTANAEGTA